MVNQELMTWTGSRWTKKVPVEYVAAAGCKLVSVSPRQLKTDTSRQASRQAANDWWKAKVAEWMRVHIEPKKSLVQKRRQQRASWLRANGREEEAIAQEAKSDDQMHAELVDELADEILAHRLGLDFENTKRAAVWKDRTSQPKVVPNDLQIITQVKAFLEHKALYMTTQAHINLSRQVNRFAKFMGEESSIEAITGNKLLAYHDHLIKAGLAKVTTRDLQAGAKQFVVHLTELEKIAVPTMLHSKKLKVKVVNRLPVAFDVAEVQQLLSAAEERFKLVLLLAMNCGYTQADIGDLTHEVFDAKAGTITRKRSKTEAEANTPEVTYRLWPETLKLLKKFASPKGSDRLFLTEEGAWWLTRKDHKKGTKKSDNVSEHYRDLRDRVNPAKPKPFKTIRKTSATLMRASKEYGSYAQYFLGHAPNTVIDTHYAVPDQRQFDAAVKWLGERYGLAK